MRPGQFLPRSLHSSFMHTSAHRPPLDPVRLRWVLLRRASGRRRAGSPGETSSLNKANIARSQSDSAGAARGEAGGRQA